MPLSTDEMNNADTSEINALSTGEINVYNASKLIALLLF